MKTYYDKLEEEKFKLYEKIDNLQKVLPLLKNQDEITDKIFETNKKIKNIDKEAKEFRKNCNHPKWEYEGDDSHYSYEKCLRCSALRKM